MPTASADLYYLTIRAASELIAARRLSPIELVRAHLDRIEVTDGKLNSFITLLADEAMKYAWAAEDEIQSGEYKGPLHGIPVGLKDLYYTKGVRTTIGSKVMADFVPDYDATVTERFREAGAVLLGKLQMHEFALGGTSENPHYGPAHNPWDTERITGGSSGGSGSSVAAGQCMAALGSDTGGSVRIPSCLCGIVGFKPTFGRVSRRGVFPLSWSYDTVGPMTRTVMDAALVLNAIAGYDPRDPSSADRPPEDFTATVGQEIAGVRIGLPREYFFDMLEPGVRESVAEAARALEGLGAAVEEVSVPMLELGPAISRGILNAEAAEIHMDVLRDRPEDLDPAVRTRLETGVLTPAVDYVRAQRARRVFARQVAAAFKQVDVIMTPTCPIAASKIGDTTVQVGDATEAVLAIIARLTLPFNISGSPTITVPCGFTSTGLPIGLQLAGRLFDEATVLRVAHAYEQATDWHTRRPPL